jgi:integrase
MVSIRKMTEATIQRAKPGEYADPQSKGLRLIVSPRGARSWEYRYKLHERLRRIRLGQYPTVGLSEARKRWEAAKAKRDDGIDPHEARDQERAEKAAAAKAAKIEREREQYTVAVLAHDYLRLKESSSKSLSGYRALKTHVDRIAAAIGDKPVAEVTRTDCRAVFERHSILVHVDADGKRTKRPTPIMANRMAGWGHAMWTFAIERDKAMENPWSGVKQHDEKPSERTLSTAELRRFVRWLPDSEINATVIDALWLVLLTGCRVSEITNAQSSMIDAEERTLKIENTKNGTDHVVHLSDQAWSIVNRRLGDGALFASERKGSMLYSTLLARALKPRLADAKIAAFTPHDLRRTMATWLGEQEDCNPSVIERMLNHRGSSVTARHYNWAKLNQPAKRWWQAWSDHLTSLAAGNIVELRHG